MADRYRNVDYTDRELLTLVYSINGEAGATSEEVADKLGISIRGKGREKGTAAGKIAGRLAWMRKFGFLERLDSEGMRIGPGQPIKTDSVWSLTSAGKSLMGGNITKGVQTALERMDPGSQVLLMRALSQRGYVNADRETAIAIRREWQHQMAQRA